MKQPCGEAWPLPPIAQCCKMGCISNRTCDAHQQRLEQKLCFPDSLSFEESRLGRSIYWKGCTAALQQMCMVVGVLSHGKDVHGQKKCQDIAA